MYQGQERQRRCRLLPAADGTARLVVTTGVVNEQGEFCGFAPPRDTHRVWNAGPSTAISLHVYGADISRLGSSVRQLHQLPADC